MLAALAAVAIGTCGGSHTGPTHGTVERVVDGDTIIVRTSDGTERVRYIGLDTPESVKPNTPVMCFAKTASHINSQLVLGKGVTLTPGAEPRDRYGRLLAYVRTDGGVDVNSELLARGAARTMAIGPNTARATAFSRLEEKARTSGLGLWGVCGYAQSFG